MRDMYHCFGKTYMANPYKKTIGELFHLTLNCHSILARKATTIMKETEKSYYVAAN